jgi:hypothetical protein
MIAQFDPVLRHHNCSILFSSRSPFKAEAKPQVFASMLFICARGIERDISITIAAIETSLRKRAGSERRKATE